MLFDVCTGVFDIKCILFVILGCLLAACLCICCCLLIVCVTTLALKNNWDTFSRKRSILKSMQDEL